MDKVKLKELEYDYILSVLDRRSRNVRRNLFFLIYSLVFVVAFVVVIAYNIQKNGESPLAKAISSVTNSRQQSELKNLLNNAALSSSIKGIRDTLGKGKINSENIDKNVASMSDKEVDQALRTFWTSTLFPEKTTSEQIAESIAGLIISFSVLMFIGFVMRAILVFVKYYMQLGTDFENQKIAFMLSAGDSDEFSKNLSNLRAHNITFEKTPSLPQEKLISKIIELVNISKKENKP